MQKKMMIIIAVILVVIMSVGCSDLGLNASPSSTINTADPNSEATGVPYEQRPEMKIGALKGPTGIGMVKLMEENAQKTTENQYSIDLYTTPTDLVGLISNGEIDVAAVPTNLASILYNKTGGEVQMMASITLGVLYILQKGESIQSIEDLRGKTIYASGEGSTPEYALNYILTQNGIDPEKDVTIEYKAEHTELATLALAGQADIVMLPEPFVTTVLDKDAGFRIAVDLNAAWETASGGESLFSMSALIVRKAYAQNNKEALSNFLTEYQASAAYVNEQVAQAAQLVAKYGIIPSAEIAEKAIPNCSILYLDGPETQEKINAYLSLLKGFNPTSIGGKLPDEDFYYQK